MKPASIRDAEPSAAASGFAGFEARELATPATLALATKKSWKGPMTRAARTTGPG